MASMRTQYEPMVIAAARKYGVPVDVYARMIAKESDDYADDVISGRRNSSAGAKGIAQFMDETAAEMGINPLDPVQAIDAGARYFKQQIDYFGGDIAKGAAAYNAGAGNVEKAIAAGGHWFDNLPGETQSYLGAGGRTYQMGGSSGVEVGGVRVTGLPNTGSSGGFVLPVGNAKVTQGFGPTNEPRDTPLPGTTQPFNKGYDYDVPVGTPVKAAVGGQVIAADVDPRGIDMGWGLSVWVKDDQGNVHNYGHLSQANVNVGQRVEAGEVVALSGNTGSGTGPHLSWDVWKPTDKGPQYFDYLQQNGGGNMVMGNGQVGNTSAGAGSRWQQIQATIQQVQGLLDAEMKKPPEEQDPVAINNYTARLTALYQIKPDEAESSGRMTAAQAAQLGINASAEQRAATSDYNNNLRNYYLDKAAAGEIPLKEALAAIQRYTQGSTLAENQSQNDIANQVKLAEASAYPGQQFYAGFEPGGLASQMSQFSAVPGGAGPGGMRIQTTNINPQQIRQQAQQAFGVEGPIPTLPPARGAPEVYDPRTGTAPPPSPGVAAAQAAAAGFSAGGGGPPPPPAPPPSWTKDENGNWVGTSPKYPAWNGPSQNTAPPPPPPAEVPYGSSVGGSWGDAPPPAPGASYTLPWGGRPTDPITPGTYSPPWAPPGATPITDTMNNALAGIPSALNSVLSIRPPQFQPPANLWDALMRPRQRQ